MMKFETMDHEMVKQVGNLDDAVRALSDTDEIKKTYLSTANIEKPELQQYVKAAMEEDQGDYFEITEQLDQIRNTKHKLGVRILITELLHTDKQKTLRRVLSPIVSAIPTLKQQCKFEVICNFFLYIFFY